MSSSRESSPDWLRTFKAPAQLVLTLSSGSEPSLDGSPGKDDDSGSIHDKTSMEKTPEAIQKDTDHDGEQSPLHKTSKVKSPKKKQGQMKPTKKRKKDSSSEKGNASDGKISRQKISERPIKSIEQKHSVLTLSSDSESCPDTDRELSSKKTARGLKKEKDKVAVIMDIDKEPSDRDTSQVYQKEVRDASKKKSPKKGLKTGDAITEKEEENKPMESGIDVNLDIAEEEISEKPIVPQVSSSRLPLVLSEKVQCSKALVECDGESIDLSGDVGAVGRVIISDNPSRNDEMFLDLKGTIYKTTIVPSRTFCVVNFGHSEAKIEAIMNDFIQLKPQSNPYEGETMIEGTLEGFSFDSEDEADNLQKTVTHQSDQKEVVDEQSNGKTKEKAEKTSAKTRRKGKAAGGKPTKKVKRKSQFSKKTKANK